MTKDFEAEIIEVRKALPAPLALSIANTIAVLDRTLLLTPVHRAMLWQSFALAFTYGEERGLQKGFDSTLNAISSIGKPGK